MAIAVSKQKSKTYILKCDHDQPTEDQTVFTIGTLSRRAMSIIKDGTMKFEVIGDAPVILPQQFSMCAAAVKFGLKAAANFRHEDGSEAKLQFVTSHGEEVLTEASLDMLLPYIEELGNEILAFNRLSETDLGNSASSQSAAQHAANSEAIGST